MARFDGDGSDNRFDGGAGADIAYGYDGDDILAGGAGADGLYGGNGNDVLLPGTGRDYVDGGTGNDILSFADLLDGVYLEGNRAIADYADPWSYVIWQADRLYWMSWFDSIDTVIGSDFGDYIQGTGYAITTRYDAATDSYVDVEVSGEDKIFGSRGDDRISGWTEADRLNGGSGNDTLNGEQGDDRLVGGGGNDQMVGGSEDDWLSGGRGRDVLDGSTGRDRLIGGDGPDRFVFRAGDSGGVGVAADRIYDFSAAERDRIDLTGFDGDAVRRGIQPVIFIGTNAPSGRAGELWITFSNDSAFIHIDTDGDAITDFDVRLNGVTSMSASDFIY